MTPAAAHRLKHLLTLSPKRIAQEMRRMEKIEAGDRFWERRVVRTVLKAAAWYFGGLLLIASSLMVHSFDVGRVLYVTGMVVCCTGHVVTVLRFWAEEGW